MMTNDKAINCNLSLLEFMKIENMLHPNCVFADDNFEALEMANSALKAQSADCDCITDEQAIEHLQSTGWMRNHDREMYESGLRKQLADDSRGYDALIPSEDTISRQAAIECLEHLSACDEPFVEIGTDDETFIGKYEAITEISDLPPHAQPERKTGKWIEYISDHGKCSRCGNQVDLLDGKEHNFCEVCGADMRGKQNE